MFLPQEFSRGGNLSRWDGGKESVLPVYEYNPNGEFHTDGLSLLICELCFLTFDVRVLAPCDLPLALNTVSEQVNVFYDTEHLARIIQCAGKRRRSSVGESPTRQLSLQPVATGAEVEAMKRMKPPV